jgi:uncharacterized metal-binding protein YceD (DUF177 family)
MSRTGAHPWSVPVAIHEVPLTGRHVDLAADESTRAAVAQAVGLRTLPRLEATFDVTHHGREGLRVVGRVSATVGQECVVTLEPVENEVEEQIDLVFAPAVPSIADDSHAKNSLPVDEDAPETLVGGTVDLAAIATEFLTLGIDPYPRRPGAEFASRVSDDKSEHPFAALAALKDKAKRS